MKKIFIALFLISVCFNLCFSQIDFTPYPGNTTHCPGEIKKYSASGSNCGPFTWTITNGKIINPSNNNEVTTLTAPSVDIRWDDFAGNGKLKVSATCGFDVASEEKNFLFAH